MGGRASVLWESAPVGTRVQRIFMGRQSNDWAEIVAIAQKSITGNRNMSDHVVPHFHNDAGVPIIEIGSQEFMCVGANPPFDHPHVFLDLGNDNEIICPYCSTLYRYATDLRAGEARPPECVLKDKVA
jgi:uncharacterized Zn-finger protein